MGGCSKISPCLKGIGCLKRTGQAIHYLPSGMGIHHAITAYHHLSPNMVLRAVYSPSIQFRTRKMVLCGGPSLFTNNDLSQIFQWNKLLCSSCNMGILWEAEWPLHEWEMPNSPWVFTWLSYSPPTSLATIEFGTSKSYLPKPGLPRNVFFSSWLKSILLGRPALEGNNSGMTHDYSQRQHVIRERHSHCPKRFYKNWFLKGVKLKSPCQPLS